MYVIRNPNSDVLIDFGNFFFTLSEILGGKRYEFQPYSCNEVGGFVWPYINTIELK